MLKDYFLGIKKCGAAFGFLSRHKLWHFIIYPIIVALILFVVFATGLRAGVTSLSDWVFGLIDVEVPQSEGNFWDKLKYYGAETARYGTMVIVSLGSLYLYYKVQKYVLLIIMSPVMALLSEKVEVKLHGSDYPFDLPQLVRDIWRGTLLALRNLSIELLIMVLVFGFNLIVGFIFSPLNIILSPLSAVFLFIIGSYFSGFSILDYNNERQRLSVRESVMRVRSHKGVAMGIGSVYMICLLIPILGATLATVICTTGATLAWEEKGLLIPYKPPVKDQGLISKD